MKKQFFVIGTKDNVVVSVAGPFNMSEAMEAESAKQKRTSDIRFEIVHESKMGDTNA